MQLQHARVRLQLIQARWLGIRRFHLRTFHPRTIHLKWLSPPDGSPPDVSPLHVYILTFTSIGAFSSMGCHL